MTRFKIVNGVLCKLIFRKYYHDKSGNIVRVKNAKAIPMWVPA